MDITKLLGKRKFVANLDYEIKPIKSEKKLAFDFKFSKKDIKRVAKGLKLTDKYLLKMEKLGFKIQSAEYNVEETKTDLENNETKRTWQDYYQEGERLKWQAENRK